METLGKSNIYVLTLFNGIQNIDALFIKYRYKFENIWIKNEMLGGGCGCNQPSVRRTHIGMFLLICYMYVEK